MSCYPSSYPASPCIVTGNCWIPFIVPPKSNVSAFCGANFGPDSCNPGCAYVAPPECDYDFLCEDGCLEECPDLHRTCTRSDCAVPVQEKAPIQLPPPVKERPAPRAEKSISSSASGSVSLTVTAVSKIESANAKRIPEGALVWAIDGKPGAVLSLTKGVTYRFNVQQSRDPDMEFYISADSFGPGDALKSRDGTPLPGTRRCKSGVLTFKPTDSTPVVVYYHSTKHPFCGGVINIY